MAGEVTRNVFGSLRQPEDAGDIPVGYTVEHDPRGNAFLVAFGEGYYLYFDFLKALLIFDFLLVLLGIVAWAPHIKKDGWYEIGVIQQRFNLYIVSYSPDTKKYWMGGTIAACAMTFLAGPLYALRLSFFFRRRQKVDHEGHFGAINDRIPGNENLSWGTHFCRQLITYALMLVFLAVSAAVTFALIVLRENAAGFRTKAGTGQVQLAFAFAIAVFLKISNALWFYLSEKLTAIEKHQTYSQKKQHLTLKFFIFRVLNVAMIYISAWLIHHEWYNSLVRPEYRITEHPCGIPSAGDEYFIIFMSEIVWATLFNLIFYPMGIYFFKRWIKGESHDEENRKSLWSAFDVSAEYMELLYRQLIIYLGLSVFPLVSLLAVISHLLSYAFDRVRITRFSSQPRPLTGFLVFFLLATAAVGAGLFPNGIIWIVSGFYYKRTVFAAGNTTEYFHQSDF